MAVTDGKQMLHDTCVSRVRFRDLVDQEIDAYIASGEPMGKAGAYAIQGPRRHLRRAAGRQLLRRDGASAVRNFDATLALRHQGL